MSRPLRILYANAWYHVMNRGATHAATFHDNGDYHKFLKILAEIHRRFRFEIHAYCLMPNHYHILVRTPLANLSRGMRHLDGLYTQFYNKKHQKDGALFRGRYKAILIDAENYMLRLSRYIHLNPAKARLVNHPGKYRWSSYRFYKGNVTVPDWLYTQETLAQFGTTQQKNKYSLFVMEKTDHELENFYRKAKLLPILGCDTFRKQISEKYLLENHLQSNDIPDGKKVHIQPSLLQISQTVANYYHVPTEKLHKAERSQGNQPRAIAIYLATELSGNKFQIIADFFKNISCTGVSQIIHRINKLRANKPSLASDIANLCKLIINGKM